MVCYCHPAGVNPVWAGNRPLLTLPSGGRVAVDRALLKLWQLADGRSLDETLAASQVENLGLTVGVTVAALACLADAGLLEREPVLSTPVGMPMSGAVESAPDAVAGPEACAEAEVQATQIPTARETETVSAVVVGYNSREWLAGCFNSLLLQSRPPDEIVFVDNASEDDSAAWTAEHYPQVLQVRLDRLQPLAAAYNRGIEQAVGAYILLLNPDVVLAPDALAVMMEVAQADPNPCAVAAKLRLMWAPAFLNGLGNVVGAWSWGTDSGLGHLDLGQFDDWIETPSVCFAAALAPRSLLIGEGQLDEGFPMYYEDSEWGYRLRLMGNKVLAAPQAVVYHAYSGRVPSGKVDSMAEHKLSRVVYGRLRWAALLLDERNRQRILRNYRLEDRLRMALSRLRGRRDYAQAIRQGWEEYQLHQDEIERRREMIQARRACPDQALFALQQAVPPPSIWRGLPLLTLDAVSVWYGPWLASGAARKLPEWQANPELPLPPSRPPGTIDRAIYILRHEGLAAMLERLAREWLWRAAQP